MQVRRANVGSKRSDTVMPVSSATIAGNLVFTSGLVGWPPGMHEMDHCDLAGSAPARTTVGIADLAGPGLLIEIGMIAVLPDSAAQSPTAASGG